MPTYIYKDIENEEEFEYRQSMNDKPLEFWPEDVPGYDQLKPRKVIRKIGGGTGFILKGTGWYKSDYTDNKKTKTTADSDKGNTNNDPNQSSKNKTIDKPTKK